MPESGGRVERVAGRGCVLRGDDIDTDRIIPARFLRCVTFDGLGEHAFADDRAQAKGDHPLDDERFAGARVLIVGRNFGCGSSREHAPQSLLRHGFEAFVGGSFAEIFAGNCTALGLPCLVLGPDDLDVLMNAVEARPEQEVVVDVAARSVRCDVGAFAARIPDGTRTQLLEGSWNATAVLLEAGDAIERAAARLPYVAGFLSLVLLFLLGCFGPSDQRPGLALRGELVEQLPADWSFTDAHREIAVQVSTPYLVPHSVTIWCAARGGELYVGAREPDTKRWPGWVDRRPDVRLRVGEQIYPVRLVPVEDEARLAAIRSAYAAKYDLPADPGPDAPPIRYWVVTAREGRS